MDRFLGVPEGRTHMGGHWPHQSSLPAARREMSCNQERGHWTACLRGQGGTGSPAGRLGRAGRAHVSGKRMVRIVPGGPCQSSDSLPLRPGPFPANAPADSRSHQEEGCSACQEKVNSLGLLLLTLFADSERFPSGSSSRSFLPVTITLFNLDERSYLRSIILIFPV